tara:strand:+ start:467 stop:1018 length:552 start_codon:yes stop_codon:yes gene_type:complete
MPIRSDNYEKLSLELKSIDINKVKDLSNIMYLREYNASKSENKLAKSIHEGLNGLLGIKPTDDFWSPVDLIIYHNKLNIKFYVELKDRHIEDKYETLMIGRSKVCLINHRELYPTYVVNQFKNKTYVYVIDSEDFLISYKRDDKNMYIPKSICFSFEKFIELLQQRYLIAYNHHQLNSNTIIP